MMNCYVDDCYAIIFTKGNKIWTIIEQYIRRMNQYYINNQLKMNMKKTMVMIFTNKLEEKEKYITIDGNIIKHDKKIKILGIMFNEDLKWNCHINEGSQSLISQLKQRLNSLKLISKTISQRFARQMANALIMSKIFYNIEIWGDTTLTNRKKINKIIYDAAKTVIGTASIGRTNKWLLNEMKWFDIEKCHENAVQNYTYKMINSSNNHYFKTYLTTNRSIRIEAQNKVRHHDIEMGQTAIMQRTYLYRAVNTYNKLPRNLTLIKNPNMFKKWLKKYNLNNNIKLKEQDDFTRNNDDIENDNEEENDEEECYDRMNDENEEENNIDEDRGDEDHDDEYLGDENHGDHINNDDDR